MASSATVVWSSAGTVEGRGDDLALHRPLHVGDLFRTLVDQDDHQVALGVVVRDRVGDRLHDHGLAGLRRGHDQTALALTDRRDEVDDAGRQHARVGLQTEPVLRVKGRQLVELRPPAPGFGGHAVRRVEADQRVELLAALAVLGLTDRAGDVVTLAQTVLADLGEGDVHVVRAGQVARRTNERVVVEDVQDARDGDQDVVVGDLRLVAGRTRRGHAGHGGPGNGRGGRGGHPRSRRRPGAVVTLTVLAVLTAAALLLAALTVLAVLTLLVAAALATCWPPWPPCCSSPLPRRSRSPRPPRSRSPRSRRSRRP
jgi:hypothetical protein